MKKDDINQELDSERLSFDLSPYKNLADEGQYNLNFENVNSNSELNRKKENNLSHKLAKSEFQLENTKSLPTVERLLPIGSTIKTNGT